MDKLIIGAGLYGLYAALYCGKRGQQVEVLEIEQAPFTRATYINQARVHMGYHYPRSLSTAMKSAGYFKRFVEDYSFCIHTKFEQIYATSSHFSWTDATEFRKFCQDAGIPCKPLPVEEYFQPGLCDGAFLTEEYTVTSDFDRMGCRLEGPFIAPKDTTDMISDGIAYGSVQVPSHGKPIVLLSDRQTTGGYPKLATVASVDIPKLVQRKTDHRIHFTAISVEEAQKLYREEEKAYEKMRSEIHVPCREVLDCRLVAKRVSKLFE